MKKEYLMIPGPTPIPREVSQALGAEIFNHRGSKFKTLIEEVTVKLKKIFETNNDLFIPVSYTHLDVYKRQGWPEGDIFCRRRTIIANGRYSGRICR